MGICPHQRVFDQLSPELTLEKQQMGFARKSVPRWTLMSSHFLKLFNTKSAEVALRVLRKGPQNDVGASVSPCPICGWALALSLLALFVSEPCHCDSV